MMRWCALLGCVTAAAAELHHITADDNDHHTMEYWRTAQRAGRRHWVVRFGRKVTCQDIRAELGDIEVDPVPPNGHAVYATLDDIMGLGWKVTWLREVLPKHKVSASVDAIHARAMNTTAAAGDSVRHALVVTAGEAVDLKAALEHRGVPVLKTTQVTSTKHKIVFSTAAAASKAVRLLAAMDHVRYVEEGRRTAQTLNHIATWTTQSQKEDHRPLWNAGLDGTNEIIQVGDTGLDYDMCFFRDENEGVKHFPLTNPKHRKVLSYFPFSEEGKQDASDKVSAHGTHVAGSLAGKSLGDHSEANGLAKEAKLFVHDFTPESQILLPPDLTTYFTPAWSVGARVSCNSWGNDAAPSVYEGTDIETDRFMWNHQDFLAVFASGNRRLGGILSPANAKNSLSVGAHENSVLASRRDNVAAYSANGPTFDKRIKPDITAPGGPVSSAHSDGNLLSGNCGLASKRGTSMAAPFVAAAAALVRQYFRDGFYQRGTAGGPEMIASGTLMKAMVIHSGEAMFGNLAEGGSSLPDKTQGYGRMALQNVLYLGESGAQNHLAVINNKTVAQGEEHSMCFRLNQDPASAVSKVRATLVWMDPPAAVGSKQALVNDLDLLLQTPDAMLHHANSKDTFETNSNVERVEVEAVYAGVYRAFVTGHHIHETHPYRGVPFSIVVSAPGIEVLTDEACGQQARCPGDGNPKGACSGADHGTCNGATGLCECTDSYFHVDCGFCNSATLCSGHGVCDEESLTCNCNDHSKGAKCDTCEDGWFGPDCDGDCLCRNGAECDRTSGKCICVSNPRDGYFEGKHCELCSRGYRGDSCLDKSWWCENNEVVKVTDLEGWVQINGGPMYQNGMICKWQFDYPEWHSITFTFKHITVEDKYDTVKIFDGLTEHGKLAFSQDGHVRDKVVTHKGGRALVKFLADQIQNDVGFEMHFKVNRKCTADNVTADGVVCSGHGSCEDIGSAVDCRCDSGYGGHGCQVRCPSDYFGSNTSAICSSHGTCSASTGTCTCAEGFFGEACQWCLGLACMEHLVALHNPAKVWSEGGKVLVRVDSGLNLPNAQRRRNGPLAPALEDISELALCILSEAPGVTLLSVWDSDGGVKPALQLDVDGEACLRIRGGTEMYIVEARAHGKDEGRWRVLFEVLSEEVVTQPAGQGTNVSRDPALEKLWSSGTTGFEVITLPTPPSVKEAKMDTYLHTDAAHYIGSGFAAGFLCSLLAVFMLIYRRRRQERLLREMQRGNMDAPPAADLDDMNDPTEAI